jgi:hypothetical protein
MVDQFQFLYLTSFRRSKERRSMMSQKKFNYPIQQKDKGEETAELNEEIF